MKRFFALFIALMLVLPMSACGAKETTPPATEAPAIAEATTTSDVTVLGEGATVFYFNTTDLDGNETKFEIHTDAATVGEALVALELISGTVGEYGLMVETVNGITLNWDTDQAYWGFFIDGEYAMTGVDSTDITAGTTYALTATKG